MSHKINFLFIHTQASSIDIDVTAHAASTDRSLSTGVAVNYMMTHGDYEVLYWHGEFDRLRRSIELQVRTLSVNTPNL